MVTSLTVFSCAVFLVGFACGALISHIQRRREMAGLRQQYGIKLQAQIEEVFKLRRFESQVHAAADCRESAGKAAHSAA